jgi:hypothetical protein
MNSESGFAMFGLNVDVTPEGLSHVDEIVSAVYQYLRMLSAAGPQVCQSLCPPPSCRWRLLWRPCAVVVVALLWWLQKWVFDEVSSIANASFRFLSKQSPINFCTDVAQNLHIYSPEHCLTGSRLYWTFDPAGIMSVLSQYVCRDGLCCSRSSRGASLAHRSRRRVRCGGCQLHAQQHEGADRHAGVPGAVHAGGEVVLDAVRPREHRKGAAFPHARVLRPRALV